VVGAAAHRGGAHDGATAAVPTTAGTPSSAPSCAATEPTRGLEWAGILAEFTDRFDRGRTYDRDVPALLPAVAALVDAFNRRRS